MDIGFNGATVPAQMDVEDLPVFFASGIGYGGSSDYVRWDDWGGEKFPGGFGDTIFHEPDYWILRLRSGQLFRENIYAKGMIRRLLTNEISTGLTPESVPETALLGMEPDALEDWGEEIETRFAMWAAEPLACDYKGLQTFGQLQRSARMEALVGGDVLVVLRPSRKYGIPRVQLVPGWAVQSPLTADTTGVFGGKREILHGVEFDKQRREVAYWIRQEDGKVKRIPAYGERTGRRVAWLVYGTDKRLDDIRGEPLLSVLLQSLKELDRYRDAVLRKAVVNSIIAMFIKRDATKRIKTMPVSKGGARTKTVESPGGETRQLKETRHVPGVLLEQLEDGEEPVAFDSSTADLDYGKFEEAVVSAMAWVNEVPPEIMRLAFSNNYSASQAAINELKIYVERRWSEFGENFCAPVWKDWTIAEALLGRLSRASEILKAWRDKTDYTSFTAWVSAFWYGSIKPSTDMLKSAKGSQMLVNEGWSTNAREARSLTGTKYARNIRKIARENKKKAEALQPLVDLGLIGKAAPEPPSGGSGGEGSGSGDGGSSNNALVEQIVEAIEPVIEEKIAEAVG